LIFATEPRLRRAGKNVFMTCWRQKHTPTQNNRQRASNVGDERECKRSCGHCPNVEQAWRCAGAVQTRRSQGEHGSAERSGGPSCCKAGTGPAPWLRTPVAVGAQEGHRCIPCCSAYGSGIGFVVGRRMGHEDSTAAASPAPNVDDASRHVQDYASRAAPSPCREEKAIAQFQSQLPFTTRSHVNNTNKNKHC